MDLAYKIAKLASTLIHLRRHAVLAALPTAMSASMMNQLKSLLVLVVNLATKLQLLAVKSLQCVLTTNTTTNRLESVLTASSLTVPNAHTSRELYHLFVLTARMGMS